MNNASSRSFLAAAVAFAVALFVFGGAMLRAMSIQTVTAADRAAHADAVLPATHVAEQVTAEELAELLDNDPFQPDRTRPATRYRLPGDVDPPPPPPPPEPPPLPDFRVAGTAVTGDGGIAMMRIGDGPTRVLAVGEYMGGYWLERVSQETATMKNEEREITVVVPGPSSTRVATQPQAPPRPQGRQAPQQGQRQQMTAEQAALMRQALEQARAQGATPQMLQALERMIQERGIDSFRNMDVQIQGTGMTIRSRPPDTTRVPPPAPPRQ